jgi:hypothetical protein
MFCHDGVDHAFIYILYLVLSYDRICRLGRVGGMGDEVSELACFGLRAFGQQLRR